MAGSELQSMKTALDTIMIGLRRDPYALETAWVSVIVFAGRARTLTPLREMIAFIPPELPIGGGTAIGKALEHLMNEIRNNVIKGTTETKGDWRPLVFLLTDGRSTDDASGAITTWQNEFRSKVQLVAVSIGGQADHSLLSKITEDVIIFNDTAPEAFTKFASWVSQSIQTQSQNVAGGRETKVDLSKVDDRVISRAEITSPEFEKSKIDERYLVLVGRCSTKRVPYLLKYELSEESGKYAPKEGMQIDETYFEYLGEGQNQSVKSDKLTHGMPCPCCDATFGVSGCSCGNLICTSNAGDYTCPWCKQIVGFGPSNSFDVKRGRG
jgi:uncharacterized protein YegL